MVVILQLTHLKDLYLECRLCLTIATSPRLEQVDFLLLLRTYLTTSIVRRSAFRFLDILRRFRLCNSTVHYIINNKPTRRNRKAFAMDFYNALCIGRDDNFVIIKYSDRIVCLFLEQKEIL